MRTIVKSDFSGGLRYALGDSSRLGPSEYTFLSNGRNSANVISPVRKALDTNLPVGTLQGLYGFGDFALAFVNGIAWYRRVSSDTWAQVPGVVLSDEVETIWAAAVPASTINRERRLITSDNEEFGVKFSALVPGTPAGIVVSDGIGQPWIIFSDGYARLTARYSEWAYDGNREYVPAGITHLLWANGKLYGVKLGAVISSVTGRPLDFVIAIREDGNKEEDEDSGGAMVTAHNADYAPVTCLHQTGFSDGSFLLGTTSGAYLLTPDYNFTLFGEHTWSQRLISEVGIPSPFSGVAIQQDYAFTDYNGPKTVYEVAELGRGQKEGNKDVGFTSAITELFAQVTQDVAASINFEGYTYFLCKTSAGYAIVVWNPISKMWVSIDQYTGVQNPKYLAVIRNGNNTSLYLGTRDAVFELFAGSGFETCVFSPGDVILEQENPNDSFGKDLRVRDTHLYFNAAYESGSVYVTPYSSQQGGASVELAVAQNATRTADLPYARSFSGSPSRISANTPEAPVGWRVSSFVSWAFDAELCRIVVSADVINTQISYAQQGNFV